jgi:branched-chain amino acid transport system ATP-binding protein
VTALLAATGISAGYGKKTVVHTVDLALQPREILVVLGHNGCRQNHTVAHDLRANPCTIRHSDIRRSRHHRPQPVG